MSKTLLRDANERPDLFQWHGPVPSTTFSAWIGKHGLVVPPDLLSFWLQTAGGDAFETESFLTPVPEAMPGDGLFEVNEELWQRGLPRDHLVFHTGLTLSAVQLDGRYVEMDRDTHQVIATFESLDDWYCNTIRAEYASRYGLHAVR